MANGITGIDHVLIAVRDITAAADAFTRLGFAVGPSAIAADSGTVSRSVSLGEASLELVAATDQGIIGVALRSSDTEASCASLRRAGIAVEPPVATSRSIGDVVQSYSTVTLPEGTLPGLSATLYQPLSPVSESLAHPNGASGIVSLTVLAEQPLACMAAYDKVFGAAASTPTDEMVSVHVRGGLIYLITPDGFDHLHPDLLLDLPKNSAPAALSIAIGSLDQAAETLKANGVRFRRKSDLIAIDEKDALGLGLELVAV